MSKSKNQLMNRLKFMLGTAFGILFVLIPFNFNGTVDTILFYYLKLFIAKFDGILQLILVMLIILSALLSLIDQLKPDTMIRKQRLMAKLFSTTPFYVVNRILGAIIAIMVYFQVGPEFLFSADTGGAMLSLATQLSVIVPMMLLFQTFILEFGAMEFLGEFIGVIVRPLFKTSEICATSILSAWVGPGNAAIMGTRELFEKGYFTMKEMAIIGTQFATGSIGWIVVVSSVLGVVDQLGWIILILALVSIIVAFVSVRIPPISKYPETYIEGKETTQVVEQTGSAWNRAVTNASNRAGDVSLKNFTSKIDNMTFYVLWLTPIIVCWGTIALIVALYTPILAFISLPIQWILQLFNVADASQAASAIMSGFADNYLPVILASNIASVETRMIVAIMSIMPIIYLSETATLLTSTKAVPKFLDVVLIFIQRTFIALPFVVILVKMIL
ncbi:YjiH family protein [Enterococcus alcedinis]|uniref:Membrane protein n=1 Tax=Enterococcus alcedinis TaxID=1274384 RepID=A0A917JEU2_9ENTE|nr:arginine transporter [Enterococcus alcedinis]MBP2101913.1 nucleoside recognition membrane protein YjiH [Enterococcus alcedinis]GGI65476.1 membrane protein [Enterococcus alcedinis]